MKLSVLNKYLILVKTKIKENNVEKSTLFTVPQVSNNFGTVIYAAPEHANLVGCSFYFKNQYETMSFEGKEVQIMQYENLVCLLSD